MLYESELRLLKSFLSQYRLNCYEITDTNIPFTELDLGIRSFFGLEKDFEHEFRQVLQQIKPNVIYRLSDDFFCNYVIFQLPRTFPTVYLVIGPFTEENFTKRTILQTIEQYNVPPNLTERIMQFFGSVPYISEITAVQAMLCSFAEIIWDGSDNYTYENISTSLSDVYNGSIPDYVLEQITEQKDISFKMNLLEKRYAAENRFIKLISQGNYQKACTSLSSSTLFDMEKRVDDPIRNFKNYSIVMNTLLRKGAELGSVHPIHIDKLSSTFARKIEEIRSPEQGQKLMNDMVRKYCLLVKNYSLKDYSLLVQKVITRIDADLAAPQTLNTHAEILNVSSSYLSTLFRKETGYTLTEYVNRKRVEYGVFLLNTTNMTIQLIAEHCGVADLNYFTRIFKKYIGVTPKEYRKSLNL